MKYTYIAGTGSYVPDEIISNFKVTLKRKDSRWSNTKIATKHIYVRRIGESDFNYGAELYEDYLSGTPVNYAQSLTMDTRHKWFKGDPFVFCFNSNEIESGEEYYVKVEWCLSKGSRIHYMNRYTNLIKTDNYDVYK